MPLLKIFLPAPPARCLYWGSVSRGQARQINQGLPRLNAAVGHFAHETANVTSLAAPFPSRRIPSLMGGRITAHSRVFLCVPLYWHGITRSSLVFSSKNKRPAFILRSLHLCVSLHVLGVSERIFVRTTPRSRPLACPRCAGSMAGCVHRQREPPKAPRTPR